MIIGPDFAIGHIPKTGGDAIHAWCRRIAEPDWIVDPTRDNCKHDAFHDRPEASGKRYYALSFRRLPSWTLSFLQEAVRCRWLAQRHNLTGLSTKVGSWGDEWLAYMRQEVEITDWLRSEYLIDDFVSFVNVDRAVVAGVKTKPRLAYNHDVGAFFTSAQIEELYALNPAWGEIEAALY